MAVRSRRVRREARRSWRGRRFLLARDRSTARSASDSARMMLACPLLDAHFFTAETPAGDVRGASAAQP